MDCPVSVDRGWPDRAQFSFSSVYSSVLRYVEVDTWQ